MTDTSALAHLFHAYLNQDVFDLYANEFEAVDDFATQEPERAALVPLQIDRMLGEHRDEASLGEHLDEIGLEIGPVDGTHREWLRKIAERVRSSTP